MSNMKGLTEVLTIFILLGMSAVAPQFTRGPFPEAKSLIKSCMEGDEKVIKELKDLNMGIMRFSDVSGEFKCKLKCFLENNGIVDPMTGDFLPNGVRSKLAEKDVNADDVENVLRTCKSIRSFSLCEKAFLLMKCILDLELKLE